MSSKQGCYPSADLLSISIIINFSKASLFYESFEINWEHVYSLNLLPGTKVSFKKEFKIGCFKTRKVNKC